MSLKEFVFSRIFLKNLLAAVVTFILLTIITLAGLKIYTSHGRAYGVPNLVGMTEAEVKEAIKDEDLDYKIIDSTFISENNPGSVIDQVPKPGFKVKKNRTVLLTINSWIPEKVTMPKFTNISFRQAQAQIENLGLRLGRITYSPSEFNDLVLKAMSNYEEIHQGDILSKGSAIDLVVGKGSGLDKTSVPDLSGMSIGDAKIAILDALLTPGVIIYDESVLSLQDSVNARVWKQRPVPGDAILGSSIDLWVTVNEQKIIPPSDNQTKF
jgi:eukaryotic-like serine/threonine-protein kinase